MEESNTETKIQLLITVTTGLEKYAAAELQEVLGSEVVEECLVKPGKLEVILSWARRSCDISLEALLKNRLLKLKCPEHIQLIISQKDNFCYSDMRASIDQLIESRKNSFERALSLFRDLKPDNKMETFRVSIKKSRSFHAEINPFAEYFAEKFSSVFDSFCPSLTEYDFDIIMENIEKTLYLSLKLTELPLGLLQVSKDRELNYVAVRPSIAYAMHRILSPQNGDVVLDPMCGCATLSEVSMNGGPNQDGIFHICADINPSGLEKAANNLSTTTNGYYDIVLMDSRASPFRDGVIDKITVDMPFGKKSGSRSKNQDLYPSCLKEFNRVLKFNPLSYALLLTTEKNLVAKYCIKKYNWKFNGYTQINMGGLDSCIFKVHKRWPKLRSSSNKTNVQEEEK
mmetsp:Transcript_61870/g.70972  ORF Transcript_61870/g.70972 Transcript_61870/m.70972 type:complete len:399 (+) Transcript_61870:50-1246(+)